MQQATVSKSKCFWLAILVVFSAISLVTPEAFAEEVEEFIIENPPLEAEPFDSSATPPEIPSLADSGGDIVPNPGSEATQELIIVEPDPFKPGAPLPVMPSAPEVGVDSGSVEPDTITTDTPMPRAGGVEMKMPKLHFQKDETGKLKDLRKKILESRPDAETPVWTLPEE